ncbi:hypothetical protein [Candidatus Similichlamydia laticola]|uniref:Uncharacterized protein n=1 Tax=Candidatus Similichlamydia laticola TaxID=2170265 RepID=A0A369K9R0_9BACT|nr:hypothetical protein [Candidatus Similichlamydia laticola]RDB31339.1 hypothetical protein HAT2_00557 [Candidatus Similichlamydia laticola]
MNTLCKCLNKAHCLQRLKYLFFDPIRRSVLAIQECVLKYLLALLEVYEKRKTLSHNSFLSLREIALKYHNTVKKQNETFSLETGDIGFIQRILNDFFNIFSSQMNIFLQEAHKILEIRQVIALNIHFNELKRIHSNTMSFETDTSRENLLSFALNLSSERTAAHIFLIYVIYLIENTSEQTIETERIRALTEQIKTEINIVKAKKTEVPFEELILGLEEFLSLIQKHKPIKDYSEYYCSKNIQKFLRSYPKKIATALNCLERIRNRLQAYINHFFFSFTSSLLLALILNSFVVLLFTFLLCSSMFFFLFLERENCNRELQTVIEKL